MCVFCYLFGTLSGINTDLVGTSSPNLDQSPVLIWQTVISEVLVKVWGNLSTMNESQSNCADLCMFVGKRICVLCILPTCS